MVHNISNSSCNSIYAQNISQNLLQ